MSNLIDIQSQIQKLQKQADEIKSKEFNKTVQEILAKMHAFGITAKDLQTALGGPRKGRGHSVDVRPTKAPKVKKAKSNGSTVAAKYRGPNGETWSGRGLTPRWLATLIAQGQSKDTFAIKH